MKTLETQRLILRNWKETDLEDLYEYAKIEGLGEMAGWPHHTSKEVSQTILKDFIEKDEVYAIVLKENHKVIGSLGIHPKTMDEEYPCTCQREIGYVLSKDYWGQGIMPEAVKAAISYAFEEIKVEVLWCGHFDFNARSSKVVQKCGFKFYKDGRYEASLLGKTFDEKQYLLTREDYESFYL